MISKCLLILLFLLSVLLLFMTQVKCLFIGGSDEDPIYSKLIELNLNNEDARKLTKDIIGIVSEYTDNPFVVATKLDKVIRKLDKNSLSKIKNNKKHIKVLLEIPDEGIEDIRIMEEPEGATSCDLFECPRCSARKHTYKEVQARSIDEPSNIKCVCQVCNMKWDADAND